jgi:hypothetical protein
MKTRWTAALALWLTGASLASAQWTPTYPAYPAAPPLEAAPLRDMPGGYPVPFSFQAPRPTPAPSPVAPASFVVPAAPAAPAYAVAPVVTPAAGAAKAASAMEAPAATGPETTTPIRTAVSGLPVLRKRPDRLPAPEACTTGCADNVCDAGCAEPLVGEPVVDQMLAPFGITRGEQCYLHADYLFYFIKAQNPPPPFILSNGGFLGADPDDNQRSGMRFSLGRWCFDDHNLGVEASYLGLGERNATFTRRTTSVAGSQLPFFSGIDNVLFTPTVHSRLDELDLGMRRKLLHGPNVRFDLVGGGRYLELDEDLQLQTLTAFSANPVILSSAVVLTNDKFSCDNRFVGGYLGVEGEFEKDWFFIEGSARVAVGVNRETLTNVGSTTVTAPPAPLGNQTLNRGAFVGTLNSGFVRRDAFTLMPDLTIHTGWQCGWLRLGAGYNFLYLSDVVRPNNQPDPATRITTPLAFIPGFTSPEPAPRFERTTFWAQGVSVRVEIRY